MNPNSRQQALPTWSSPLAERLSPAPLRPLRESLGSNPEAGKTVPAAPRRNVEEAAASRLPQAAALVPQAAAVLDEEMVAGAIAAHDARADPGRTPSGSSGEAQLLRDLHHLVDALGEIVPRAKAYAGGAPRELPEAAQASGGESMPALIAKAPVRAGESVKIRLRLSNEAGKSVDVILACTDLFSADGSRIPRQHMTVTPERVRLGPDADADAAVLLSVPAGTPPGSYSGLLLSSGLSYLRALIAVEVA